MSKPARPIIGITGPEAGGWLAWFFTWALVTWVGGKGLRITPEQRVKAGAIDGLIIGGGADIDPALYREKILPILRRKKKGLKGAARENFWGVIIWLLRLLFSRRLGNVANDDKARDELEMWLLRESVDRQIPVLGICRGSQIINIFFGGTLYQDIEDFYVETPRLRTVLPRKNITLEPGSRMAEIFRMRSMRVNSLHHQSVKEIGRDIIATAREHTGIVQGIEHAYLPFVIGVQWHPEFLFFKKSQRRLFARLTHEAHKSRYRLNVAETAGSVG